MNRKSAILVTISATALIAARAALAVPARTAPQATPVREPVKTSLVIWQGDLDTALARAKSEYKPALIFFSSPDCGWCTKLRSEVLLDPQVTSLLESFALCEVDISRDARTAYIYQVRGVPALLVLGGDGSFKDGATGYLTVEEMVRFLKKCLNPEFLRKREPEYAKLVDMLQAGTVVSNKWQDAAALLGDREKRQSLHDLIIGYKPFPGREMVELLRHGRIAVRLGALDILEEAAGDSFGFDPWLDPAGPDNDDAIARWNLWAGNADTNAAVTNITLSADAVAEYVRDLLSENREKAARSSRMLRSGGMGSVKMMDEFLASHPELPAASRKKVKEIQYSIIIPALGNLDQAATAYRLLFGTLDARVKAISSLKSCGRRVIPVLRDMIDDEDPIIREAAAECLSAIGGNRAVDALRNHLAAEKDADVTHRILKGLGAVKGTNVPPVLAGYIKNPNEDLVIVALESLAKQKTKLYADEIEACMDDPRWRVRVAALAAISSLKMGILVPKIESMLQDKDEYVRFAAVQTLCQLSGKKPSKRLEEAFYREDALKGAVVAGLVKMDVPLPEGFANGLAGKPPEIVLSVLSALEDCSANDLKVVERYADDPNADIAAATVRLLSSKGMGMPLFQARITAVLKGNRNDLILAALESMVSEYNEYDEVAGGDVSILHLFPDWFETRRTNAPAGGSAASSMLADDILDAINADAPAPGAAPAATNRPAVDQPVPQQPGITADDILSDIGADQVPVADAGTQGAGGTGGTAIGPGGLVPLVRQLEFMVISNRDDEIRFRAALVLARYGCPKVLPVLDGEIGKRPEKDRCLIAEALASLSGDDCIPVLRRLLGDTSREVRSKAVWSCIRHSGKEAFAGLVFEAIAGGGNLKPTELELQSVMNIAEQSWGRRVMGQWAGKYIEEGNSTDVRIFGLILMTKVMRPGMQEQVERFAASEDPYLRRAAYYALGKGAPARFLELTDKVADDPSEKVRAVLPAIYSTDFGRWVHYFDQSNSVFYYSYDYGSRSRDKTIDDKAVAALQKLLADPSQDVRLDTFFCLLSNRKAVDLTEMVKAIDSMPDRDAASSRVADFLSSHYTELGRNFGILVEFMSSSRRDEETLARIRAHFNINPDDDADVEYIVRAASTNKIMADFVDVETKAQKIREAPAIPVVYFTSPGCMDCGRVKLLLLEATNYFPGVKVTTYNIRKAGSMLVNESLCERFGVPEKERLIAPAIFAGAGFLSKKDIYFARLAELLARSASVADTNWMAVAPGNLKDAGRIISARQKKFPLYMVAFAGLSDGVNPCAFATIIFLIAYLQVARRSAREILWVGAAFIAGVFLAYFVLGMGLAAVVTEINAFKVAGTVMKWLFASAMLVLAVMNARDGILCLRGRLKDTVLQLPGALKQTIHGVIRRGARHSHFVVAAFVVGVAISLLEFACTGQVYLPTISFVIQQYGLSSDAAGKLASYCLAFITPLLVVFLLAFYGMTAERLSALMVKHAAAVKFITALMFVGLFVLYVFGGSLMTPAGSPVTPDAQ